MQRPAGVTASAVVAFLGSAVFLLLGGIMIATVREPTGGALAAVVGAAFIGFAALGIWTGVSLLRLRPWARVSILVFGGFLAVISALSAITAALVPLVAAQHQGMRPLYVGVYLLPLGIGAWWLVYFTRPGTKAAFGLDRAAAGAAFGGPSEPGPPRRPLGLAVLGWLWIVGAALSLLLAAAGWPAFVAGHMITGWSAALVYLVFGAIGLYLGRGLLKLSERARQLAIVWFGLTIAHTLYVLLTPGGRMGLAQMQRALPLAGQADAALVLTQMAIQTTFFGLAIPAAVIWMLIRYRSAFSAP
jgi:hypothetical protein